MMLLRLRNLMSIASFYVIVGGTGLPLGVVDPVVSGASDVVLSVPVVGQMLAGGCTNGVKLARYLTFFRGVDNNTNNLFEYSDYNRTAGRLLSVPNYSKLTPWDFYEPGKGLVSQAWMVFPILEMPLHVYLMLATIVSSVQPILVDRVNRLGAIMYTAFDYKGTGDGMIDREECCGMWFTFGVTDCSPAILDPCFAELDRDGDGGISKPEFIQNAVDYFNSSDPDCRCRCLLGPTRAEIPGDFISTTLAKM